MHSPRKTALTFHEKYISGSLPDCLVINTEAPLCNPTRSTCRVLRDMNSKFFLSTIALKHIYDKRGNKDYAIICEHLHTVVKYPDYIYKNNHGKRADYCFRKSIGNHTILVYVEHNRENKKLAIVTSFILRKESYVDKYITLLSWEDGKPPS